jgi:hypothetical protein
MDALDKLYLSLGLVEPKQRAARPPAAPKPKRRRRTASARVAKPKVTLSADTVFVDGKPERMRCLPELAAIATVSAAPAGTRTEKKCRPASAPRILGTGLCPGCRRRDQVLLDSSEGARCRVCNPDLEPPDD